MSYDVNRRREDFPILKRVLNGRPLVYMDNAATSLKPTCVIEAVCDFYEQHCANIHRGVHQLSQEASELYEDARYAVARFIGASEREIIFVRNASEALNLVAHSFPLEGAVVTTLAEHHSNLLAWERHAQVLKVPVSDEGILDLAALEKLLKHNDVGLVAVAHVGNGLGVINPVREIAALAREHGAHFLVDGSQSVPHMPVSVAELDCDFLVFSGHKMLGPSGIGVLYGRAPLLERMAPFLMGGDMIDEVHADSHTLANVPWRFEAGTPNIEGAIGLGAATGYLREIGMESVRAHERALTSMALEGVREIRGLRLLGPLDPELRGGVVTITRPGMPAHTLARLLSDRYSILVRSGYHCAQPLFETLGSGQTCRASLYLYNTEEEVGALLEALTTISRSV
ncbi:MAG: aminotransferase class V-fold PLP-dependent enzyme [Armatimonadota bacterium]|jgi:cysteine desulfurase/selenocysteine lyase